MMKRLIPITSNAVSGLNEKWFSDISYWLIFTIIVLGLILTFSIIKKPQLNIVTETIDNCSSIITSQKHSSASSLKTALTEINIVTSEGLNMDTLNISKKINADFTTASEHYLSSSKVQEMNQYMQHGTTSTLKHCTNVAKCSYILNRLFLVGANENDLVEASLLHDFYLYDWHDGKPCRSTHGFDHPAIASANAEKYFDISDTAKDAIESHMWPLNITQVPKSKVAVLVTISDKLCAGYETVHDNTVEFMNKLQLNNLQSN